MFSQVWVACSHRYGLSQVWVVTGTRYGLSQKLGMGCHRYGVCHRYGLSQVWGVCSHRYGLYGRYSLNGEVPMDLDDCGGHTHLIDGVMTYHYHLPDQFPWTIGCYKGCPEVSNNQQQLSFTIGEEYGCEEVELEDTTDATADPANGSVGHVYGMVSITLVLTFLSLNWNWI